MARVFEVVWQGGIADHPLEHSRFYVTAETQAEVVEKFPRYDSNGGWLVIPLHTKPLEQAVKDVNDILEKGHQTHAVH